MFKGIVSTSKETEYDVLLIGEIVVDEIFDQQNIKYLSYGGSPANIALNLTQLGLNPLLVAALGEDSEGAFLQDTLSRYNMRTDMIFKVNTATSKVQLTDSKERPIPVFNRLSDYLIPYSDLLESRISETKILHFSYWPLTKEPAKSTVLKSIKKAKKSGVLVAFDPNIHHDLYSDDSISHEELLGLLKFVDIIKPSLDDAARLFGEGYSKESYMDFFEAAGIQLILMTLGKDGVYVSHHGKRTLYGTNEVDVVDATGAGDAFWSGFYAGLINGLNLTESIDCAQKISALVLKSIGAITELPRFECFTLKEKS